MKKALEGKVALITGASRGIGKEVARAMGKEGAKLAISSRKQESLEEVVQEFSKEGIETVHAIATHMGKIDQIESLTEQTMDKYGAIDILVNNAATNPVFGPAVKTEEAAFDKIMQVNVKGPFELCKKVYPLMRKTGGSVINVSSIAGISPMSGLGVYSMSKAATISLTKVLAKEWGKDGIRVNVICPGLIKTQFSEALWGNEKILDQFTQNLPAGRIGQSEDVAGMAVFLASDASMYCTGGIYMVDGGHTI